MVSSEMITIKKSELDKFVRKIVREELEKVNLISREEQIEIEQIYGNALYEKRDKKDYVKL